MFRLNLPGNIADGRCWNQHAVKAAGGLTRIVAAMDRFPRDARVQAAACGALAQLAEGNEDVARALVRAHGARRVAAALRRHAGHAGVQERGRRALRLVRSEPRHCTVS